MCQIPASMSEYTSCDNLTTGSVLLLIRRHEMPSKICVNRYWNGLESPERLAYVPELPTCTMEPEGYWQEEYGCVTCSNCHNVWMFECDGPEEHGWTCCPHCGAIIDYGSRSDEQFEENGQQEMDGAR